MATSLTVRLKADPTYEVRLKPDATYEVSTRRRVAAVDDHVFDGAAAGAPECGGFLVLRRFEARRALLERGKLDHHEAMEVLGPFHDSVSAAARQNLPAVAADDLRHAIGIPLVLHGIGDLRARDPIGRHQSNPL